MKKKHVRGFLPYFVFAVIMALSTGAWAQQRTIRGTVTDEAGSPLPGVTVVVQGTTLGTVTSVDGVYQLDVPASANTLVFSYIGMLRQPVEIGTQTSINVTMRPDVIGVDEVVVVGYGTRMREELTGAVSTVSAEQMRISAAPSVVSRLQGQVSGVTITQSDRPGGDATIRIRGIGTINNSNPLFVIDGVPVGPGNNVNPNDIESISILKDASSSAIYGTRGANGVVIITTKRGAANQKPNLTFNVRTGMTNAINQYDLLNTQEYMEAVWLSLRNRGAALQHAQYGSGENPRIPDYILPAGAMEGDPGVNPALYNYPDYQIYKANKQGTNWYDEIYRTGIVQEYDLSVTGGGQNGSYAFSGGYLNEDGYLIHTNFKRYTFRMNADSKITNWLRVGESLQAIHINELGRFTDNAEDSSVSDAYRSQPIIPVYDIMGNFAGSRASGMGNSENPVARLYRARNNNGKLLRVLGNTYGELIFAEGLTFRSLLGYNYSQWNFAGYTIPNHNHSEPNKTNSHNRDSNYNFQWNWTNTLNFATTIGEQHKLNVVLGTEAIEYLTSSLNASRSQYFSEIPRYMTLNAGESNIQNSGTSEGWSLFSQFGRVNLDLWNKLFLEGTVRRDGSSRFAEDNRYGIFPAVGAAYAISQENFMAGTENWMDLLKLRVGWGVSGNDQIGNYNPYSTYRTDNQQAAYSLTGADNSAVKGFIPGQLGNDAVGWETTRTLNVGLDATMLDRRVTFSVDVWNRLTSDMLFQDPIPNVLGIPTAPYVNIGEMKNTGFDLELGFNNFVSPSAFKYSVNATISHYSNEILKLATDPKRNVDAGSLRQMTYTRYAVGTAFPEFYGYIVDGIFQTDAEAAAHPQFGTTSYNKAGHFKYRNLNGDAVINADDRTYIGSPHPDFTGGLNFDFSYSNFDLNLFFYGSYGNDMVNYVTRWIDYGMFNGGLSKKALYESWGSPKLNGNNAKATLPMLDQDTNSQQPSTAFVEDASFLRLKNLKLGYTVPSSLINRAQISRLHVYAQVTNLWTLTKYSGLDPEVNASGSGMGLDQGAWPTARQVMFGIQLGL